MSIKEYFPFISKFPGYVLNVTDVEILEVHVVTNKCLTESVVIIYETESISLNYVDIFHYPSNEGKPMVNLFRIFLYLYKLYTLFRM